ncbi:response regulator [Bradyrhizobium oligotrophicum]
MAAEWAPDVILLDVMMPVMDGPATLAQLRQNAATADFPVVFMTARTQARETDRFRSLGAVGVIAKPFDPMTLAALLRTYARPSHDPLEQLRTEFLRRVERDAEHLLEYRKRLDVEGRSPALLEQIRSTSHALAGAGGIYGFAQLSDVAADLEDVVTAEIGGAAPGAGTDRALDALIVAMEQCRCPAPLDARSLKRA